MLEKLTAIIHDYKADKSIVVTEGTIIKEDLSMSSFDLIQLACAVEDEFDVEVPEDAVEKMKTVGDVVKFIEENI